MKLKCESYAQYVYIFNRIKSNQFDEITEFRYDNPEIKYSAQSVSNLRNDIDQNIIDSFFLNEGLFSIVTGVSGEVLSFEEKLLFVNQSKEGQYFYQGMPVFKDINTLKEGLTFGELGLIFNKPRTSTVIASEESYMLSLSKEDYYKIFDGQIKDTLAKVRYIGQMFCGLSQIAIAKISYEAEIKDYRINEKIFEEGDEADYFYFIKSGEVGVINIFWHLMMLRRSLKKIISIAMK